MPDASERRGRLWPRFAVKSANLGHHLDVFLVLAICSVLGNRLFLIITGYPQLGDGTLHISHAIWGATMMAIAIVWSISYLGPSTRTSVAVLGGMGFGWFVDELGKFVTRDVNYFWQPTIALIYMIFVGMYLVFRSLGRRSFGPDEGMLNALEALKSASLGQLSEPSRQDALEIFDTTEPTGALAERIRSLLSDVATLPPTRPGRFARFGNVVREHYLSWTERHWFPIVIDTIFVLYAVIALLTVVSLALDGSGITSFPEWATVVSSTASGTLIVIGVTRLRRSRLHAYRWFDRGLLVDIFVTQIFVFAEEQLGAVVGLFITLTVWVMLRSAIKVEVARGRAVEEFRGGWEQGLRTRLEMGGPLVQPRSQSCPKPSSSPPPARRSVGPTRAPSSTVDPTTCPPRSCRLCSTRSRASTAGWSRTSSGATPSRPVRPGYNLARVVAILAGIPQSPGVTLNRYCSSSLQSIRMAAHAIKAGEGDVFVAGGCETVSRFSKGMSDGSARHAQRQASPTPRRAPSSGTRVARARGRRSTACPTSTSRWVRPPRTSPSTSR